MMYPPVRKTNKRERHDHVEEDFTLYSGEELAMRRSEFFVCDVEDRPRQIVRSDIG